MKKTLLLTAVLAIATMAFAQTPVYLDNSKPINDRVEDALSRMTLQEKINMVHAQSKFSSPGVPRLGIPEVWCTDGPHGIRTEVLWDEWEQAGWTNDSITAFPALTCLAATWDPEMSLLYGKSIGEEARFRNKTVLLGPGVNIYRTPLNGRNFEYMGEDPYLSSRMVVPYIQGVQSNGVATCVKHYALNNNELNRNNTNPILDERTLREIYLPAFKAAVQEAGSWTIMCAYNLYGGKWLSENDYLLNQVLKKEWGFDGVVISDWGAVHNTEGTVTGGLDLEYGSWTNGLTTGASNAYANYFMADPYKKLIQEGKLGTDELNDKCRRILRLIFRTGMNPNRPFGSINSEAHISAARTIGDNGIVLLKNDAPAQNNPRRLLLRQLLDPLAGDGCPHRRSRTGCRSHRFIPLRPRSCAAGDPFHAWALRPHRRLAGASREVPGSPGLCASVGWTDVRASDEPDAAGISVRGEARQPARHPRGAGGVPRFRVPGA